MHAINPRITGHESASLARPAAFADIGLRRSVRGSMHGRRGVMIESMARSLRGAVLLLLLAALGGCGLAAAPCRITSAALKIIPYVGHSAAQTTDACAAAIDP
jgi:hypothetical protein